MKYLVTYATFAGSTAEVAQTIASAITGGCTTPHEVSVDVRPVNDVDDISGYDGIVIGSAVRFGKLHKGFASFLAKHSAALSHRPVAYFVCCLTMKDDTEENRKTVDAYFDPIRNQFPGITPISIGLFAGCVDPRRLGLAARLITRGVKAPEGDFRRWKTIEAWAVSVGLALIGQAS